MMIGSMRAYRKRQSMAIDNRHDFHAFSTLRCADFCPTAFSHYECRIDEAFLFIERPSVAKLVGDIRQYPPQGLIAAPSLEASMHRFVVRKALWQPRRSPSTADLIRHLMDQHGLRRADMIPILGTASRVSEILAGKKAPSMTMVQRLRARFGVPADLFIPPPKQHRRVTKR